ncbi:IS701 family transposase [Streptomyces sp. V1I1]|uniref:IS701 family transposase n=1 Tax=Streptomyces sp. V1I1 TaxID=3042272 RepID=UPI0027823A7F|nr:IS701 family transposase [Streptomyces sp. V1I1]MDQ0938303.1 SRSO17 transposase [Streptomyces sp. V1I1]MDQ0946045.1 SRSO17 transposase [Streptomyces sp. V1I1]MDQ0946057.1 SRSO17 transposase [Streptomyces sp. V1I1]
MTKRVPCPPAPGPLEAYAARFDDLFSTLAQRRGFREYLAGLLLPRDRNKTLTCLAGTEPVAGAQHAAVQRLQFFLSESTWDLEKVNARRVELLLADPATAPHAGGVLVIDDSGDRKDGTATAHVGKQYLGSVGKIDRGVVAVTTCWADERVYYPLHAVPYTPAHHFPKGKNDAGFRTKLQIGAALARDAPRAGVSLRAVAADCAYGDQDAFRRQLDAAGLPFVMALKPRRGAWSYGDEAYTPVDAARNLIWGGPEAPGNWTTVTRTFRDGHTATWWAADAQLGWWGPDGTTRLVVATTDPATLPAQSTWYLATDLPRPGGPREADSPAPAADLAEIVRIYGIRHWIEQSYKQVKDELGWADFQVRSDTAIRRHQTLVTCAFSFCWDTWFAPPPPATDEEEPVPSRPERGYCAVPPDPAGLLAPSPPGRPWLADALGHAATLLASVDSQAPAHRAPGPDQRCRHRQTS